MLYLEELEGLVPTVRKQVALTDRGNGGQLPQLTHPRVRYAHVPSHVQASEGHAHGPTCDAAERGVVQAPLRGGGHGPSRTTPSARVRVRSGPRGDTQVGQLGALSGDQGHLVRYEQDSDMTSSPNERCPFMHTFGAAFSFLVRVFSDLLSK
jgi:hypothetical protein